LQLFSGKEDTSIEAETAPIAAQLVHCGAYQNDGQAPRLRPPPSSDRRAGERSRKRGRSWVQLRHCKQ
jgi:hypothetical protein